MNLPVQVLSLLSTYSRNYRGKTAMNNIVVA